MASTVRELFGEWRSAHGHLASLATEIGRAETALLPALGDRVAAELEPGDVDTYRAARARVITRRGRAPSVATVNREIMLLFRLLNFGVSRRRLAANPLRGAVKLLREPPPPDAVVDEVGLDALLLQLRHPVARAWTIVAFESGMRRGEILRLCWRQLDFEHGRILLPGAHTKSRRPRAVEFPARSQAAVAALHRSARSDLVFANPATGRAYNPRRLYRLFVAAVDAAGLLGADGKPPTWHALRRSYITLLRRRGVQETIAMRLSGHASRSVFDRYNIVSDNEISDAMAINAAGRAREIAALRNGQRRGPQRKVVDGSAGPWDTSNIPDVATNRASWPLPR